MMQSPANLQMNAARKTALLSMLCAAAIIFSYAETLIPLSIIPLPGFKLGFANIVVLIALYRFSAADALLVSIARITVVSLLFGGINAAMFSLAGGILSLIFMYITKKSGFFSIYAVGVSGAVFHNIGQLCVAAVTVGSLSVAAYLPYLMICSLITGLIMALLTVMIMNIMKKIKV